MALSKAVKARIRCNRELRLGMLKMSQQYGPHIRVLLNMRIAENLKMMAAQGGHSIETFYPAIVIEPKPWEETPRNRRRAKKFAHLRVKALVRRLERDKALGA